MTDFPISPQETIEGRIPEDSSEQRALDEATLDPRAQIEQTGNIAQSEEIQTTMTSLIETTMAVQAAVELQPTGTIEALPLPLPSPAEQVSGLPIPIPSPDETIEATPITLPIPKPEDAGSAETIDDVPLRNPSPSGVRDLPDPVPSPDETIEATPITLPIPKPEDAGSAETIDDVPLRNPSPSGVRDLPDPVPSPNETIEATPITLPIPKPEEAASAGLILSMPANDVFTGLEAPLVSTTQPEVTILRGGVETTQEIIDQFAQIREAPETDTATAAADRPSEKFFDENDLPVESSMRGAGVPDIELDAQPEPGIDQGIETPPPGTSSEISPESSDRAADAESESLPLDEVKEVWIPPEMYIYSGADGKSIVVDANGKPLDSPPKIMYGSDGNPYAYYPGADQSESFKLQTYKPVLADVYLYVGSDGVPVVVDANGKQLDSPPKIMYGSDGNPYAYYPGADQSESVELQTYKPVLTDVYLYVGSDGVPVVVDANGKQLDSPPKIDHNYQGGDISYGYYQGMEKSEFFELPMYKPVLSDVYLYVGSDNIPVVVDANGKQLDSPPKIWYGTDDTPQVYYQGMEKSDWVDLPMYKPVLTDIYVYEGSDGIPVVVDANGKPLESPPHIFYGPNGNPIAYYPYADKSYSVELQLYKPKSATGTQEAV